VLLAAEGARDALGASSRLLERLLSAYRSPARSSSDRRPHAMSQAHRDDQRTRVRRPVGVAAMAYKAILGLSEIVVGVLLAVPSFDPQATLRGCRPRSCARIPATASSLWSAVTCRRCCTIADWSRSSWSCSG